jgi:hypothetical protein
MEEHDKMIEHMLTELSRRERAARERRQNSVQGD